MLSRRSFSTSARALSHAHFTKLPNGLTVISKRSNLPTSSIGVYLNSGSRAENPYNSGVSTLLGKLIEHSPAAESVFRTEGVKLSSTGEKELSAIAVASFAPGNGKPALSTLSSIIENVQGVTADEFAFKQQVEAVAKAAEAFEADPSKMVPEHMTATAFQGTSLALPTFGKADTIRTLHPHDVKSFIGKNLVSSNVAIVGVGSDADHDALVKFAQELSIPDGARQPFEPASFLGSEVRMRDDTMPDAHIAISAKVPGAQNDTSFYTGLVASEIYGEYLGKDSLYTPFEASKLSQITHDNNLCDYYKHFQLTFSDIGLWGVYFQTYGVNWLDEAVHFNLKAWNRFTTGTVTDVELEHAKEALKVKFGAAKATGAEEAQELAKIYFTRGYLPSIHEAVVSIDEVSHKTLQTWASDNLYDQDVALAGNGQIDDLLDYNRIRNDMASLRW